ncbi:hypothetical protein [Rhodococcus sp. SGAir0479]|uniref:hypothetical protein n=1 Tax=Rhodococcus sp. SGAir0479 TaxID=2567884 RepID=UPI0010CCB588|nr:hypothetical protein [Rhodococcus sp. SGAir0479]QCQ93246.1 hypothetical protein E7742_19835 [Rhodococcus sp. SGAir0479]
MGELRRKVGFWSSLGRLRVSDLLTIEYLGCLIAGVVASVFLVKRTTAQTRTSLAGDVLALTPALLGVVFAALALVVALLSDSYLRQLNHEKDGILAFLSPFMIVIGIQVVTLVSAVAYRAFAALVPYEVEGVLFGAVVVLFLTSSLEVVSLARSVLMHGLARARLQQITDLDAERRRKRSAGE